MLDPYKLAKDNGILPSFVNEDGSSMSRDQKLAKIGDLVKAYKSWAKDTGNIDDPGPEPEPVEKPLEVPNPTDSEEIHRNFRQVMDEWFDKHYLTEYEPRVQLWMAANEMWMEKQFGSEEWQRTKKEREKAKAKEYVEGRLGKELPEDPEDDDEGDGKVVEVKKSNVVVDPTDMRRQLITMPVTFTASLGNVKATVKGVLDLELNVEDISFDWT